MSTYPTTLLPSTIRSPHPPTHKQTFHIHFKVASFNKIKSREHERTQTRVWGNLIEIWILRQNIFFFLFDLNFIFWFCSCMTCWNAGFLIDSDLALLSPLFILFLSTASYNVIFFGGQKFIFSSLLPPTLLFWLNFGLSYTFVRIMFFFKKYLVRS